MSTVLKQVDPATGVTEFGYNKYILEAVKNKVFENIFKIETLLGLKIESSYDLNSNQFVLKGLTKRIVNDTVWITIDKNQILTTEFYCSQFPFKLSPSSKLTVGFDCYFNIVYVHFKSIKREIANVQTVEILFNKNLDLESLEFKSLKKRDDVPLMGLKKTNKLLSLKDEILLFNLYNSKNDEIKELLPEYHTPSAYNFHAEDFKDRLAVYEMMMT